MMKENVMELDIVQKGSHFMNVKNVKKVIIFLSIYIHAQQKKIVMKVIYI
jgi:hypothetical protein